MKKKFLAILLILGIVAFTSATASAFLNDWYIDIDGDQTGTSTYDATQISEYLDTVGPSYIINTFTDGTTGTFEDYGAFVSRAHDGGSLYTWGTDAELTGLFYGEGNVDLGTVGSGTIDFTGGTLDIYADLSPDFATSTGTYGADNGTLIASFDVITGEGTVDPTTAVPNGEITVEFESTFLADNYWFDEFGNDLSDTDPISWILGFATTNASHVANPEQIVVDELVDDFAGNLTNYTNTPPGDFIVGTNGQYRLDAVPEPATLLLLGTGLIGLAGASRKKFFQKG